MNETFRGDGASSVPWLTRDRRMRAADSSMLPGSEKAPSAAVGLLNQAVQGAHDSLDRLAGSAAPAVKQLGESVSAARDALHGKTDQLRETRDEWVQDMRTTVRGNPLACVAAALALGVLIARFTR